jgi:hypothetical protein
MLLHARRGECAEFVTLATLVGYRLLRMCEDKAWLHFHDDLYGLGRVKLGIGLFFESQVKETNSR